MNSDLLLIHDSMLALTTNEVPQLLAGFVGEEPKYECGKLLQVVCSKDPAYIIGLVLAAHLYPFTGGIPDPLPLFIYKYGASSKLVVMNEAVARLLYNDSSTIHYEIQRDVQKDGTGIENAYLDIEKIRCEYSVNLDPVNPDALSIGRALEPMETGVDQINLAVELDSLNPTGIEAVTFLMSKFMEQLGLM